MTKDPLVNGSARYQYYYLSHLRVYVGVLWAFRFGRVMAETNIGRYRQSHYLDPLDHVA